MGSVASNVLKWETGGLNIGKSRIAGPPWKWGTQADLKGGGYGTKRPSDGHVLNRNVDSDPSGRWPANLILSHLPDCEPIGSQTVPGYQINRFTDGAKPFGDGAGHPYESEKQPDEAQPVWDCEDSCPVLELDQQGGVRKSGDGCVKRESGADKSGNQSATYGRESRPAGSPMITYGDKGSASRFFKQIQEER